jgi:hypothetical protein
MDGGYVRLVFAGGKVLVRFQPLLECGLAVANGTTDFDKRRSVTTHAGLSQPRTAHFQDARCFFRCEKTDVDRCRFRQAAADRRLNTHTQLLRSCLNLAKDAHSGPIMARPLVTIFLARVREMPSCGRLGWSGATLSERIPDRYRNPEKQFPSATQSRCNPELQKSQTSSTHLQDG